MPYLGRTLDKLESELSGRYEPQFILVDYRSVDGWMGNNNVGETTVVGFSSTARAKATTSTGPIREYTALNWRTGRPVRR